MVESYLWSYKTVRIIPMNCKTVDTLWVQDSFDILPLIEIFAPILRGILDVVYELLQHFAIN